MTLWTKLYSYYSKIDFKIPLIYLSAVDAIPLLKANYPNGRQTQVLGSSSKHNLNIIFFSYS